MDMLDRGGTPEYKCRRYGEIDNSYHVPALNMVLLYLSDSISEEMLNCFSQNSAMLSKIITHTCKDGGIGIADIIGGKPDE